MKKLLLCLLAHTISLHILSAERPSIDLSFEHCSQRIKSEKMSDASFLKLLEERNEQWYKKMDEIKALLAVAQGEIVEKHANDAEILRHIIGEKGILLNVDGQNAAARQGNNYVKASTAVNKLMFDALNQISTGGEKFQKENMDLMALWVQQQKLSKEND